MEKYKYLGCEVVDDSNIQVIVQKSHKTKIKQVWSSNAQLTEMGMKHFLNGKWNHLQAILLECYQCKKKIGIQSCKLLSKVPLPSIQQIDLSGNQIGVEGVRHLSKAAWSTLQTINLFQNNIAVMGLQYLMKAHWKSLKTIDFQCNKVTEEQCKHLMMSGNDGMQIYVRLNLFDFEAETLKQRFKEDKLFKIHK